jgi:hypothetical protein
MYFLPYFNLSNGKEIDERWWIITKAPLCTKDELRKYPKTLNF